jgi:hypothetical protein
MYRNNQPDFVSEYRKLQAIAGKIPQVAKGEVPLSVAISSYENGRQLTPETMAEQVRHVEDPRNHKTVKTKAVAFGDDLWLNRAKEQK